MATTPKGGPLSAGTDQAWGPSAVNPAVEWTEASLVQELTTAQRDLLPASARWAGRTVWERLTSGARRLVAWDQAAQQWREELAARLHAAEHASGGTDPVAPAAIGAATAGHTHPIVVLPRRQLVTNVARTLGNEGVTVVVWSGTLFRPPGWSAAAVALSGHVSIGSTGSTRRRVRLELLAGSTVMWGTAVTVEERHSTNVHSYAQVAIEEDVNVTGPSIGLRLQATPDVDSGHQIDVNLYRLYAQESRIA